MCHKEGFCDFGTKALLSETRKLNLHGTTVTKMLLIPNCKNDHNSLYLSVSTSFYKATFATISPLLKSRLALELALINKM